MKLSDAVCLGVALLQTVRFWDVYKAILCCGIVRMLLKCSDNDHVDVDKVMLPWLSWLVLNCAASDVCWFCCTANISCCNGDMHLAHVVASACICTTRFSYRNLLHIPALGVISSCITSTSRFVQTAVLVAGIVVADRFPVKRSRMQAHAQELL